MLRSLKALCLCSALLLTPDAETAPSNYRHYLERDYQLLDAYRKKYPPEIYRYCVKRYGHFSPKLGACLNRQFRMKERILAGAQRDLGQRSLVRVLYHSCLRYYPLYGVARIWRCMQSRIKLREILHDETVEKEIYRRCDSKWRKHGFRAIDNCSLHQAKYYRDRGRYYEDR